MSLPLPSAVIVLLLLGALPATAAELLAPPPPTVVVAPAVMQQESSPKRYVGAAESIRHVDIMPRVTGNLQKIHFAEGGMVNEGDLLYELEDTTYRAAVDRLIAQKELLEAALHYADTEYRRSRTLLQSKAVSASNHDKAELEIASAKAKLKEIKAALQDAENTLSYTRIYAPVTGRIGKSACSEGNLITPAGGKLTDIEMIAPIYVRFSLSERIFHRDFGGIDTIREKAQIRLQLADNTLYGETAAVTLIDNKINIATNTITLWASFANRDGALLPGSFVTVLASARNERPQVTVVPSALIAEESGYCIYVLDSADTVERRAVEIGSISAGLQVITSGLDGSERIVIDGMHKVRPGMAVTPVAPEAVR